MPELRTSRLALLFLFICLFCFVQYGLARHETVPLILTYGALFALYLWILRSADDNDTRFWIVGAVLIRLSLLFSIPTLSDDVFRFVWDGRMWHAGLHPFSATPSEIVTRGLQGLDQSLFQLLNSPEYFTVYPPFAQFTFWLSVHLSPDSVFGSIVVLRLLMIAAEVGSMILLYRLMTAFRLPSVNILLYALNPLAILELTGNLHPEGFMVFFLLLAIWLLHQHRWVLSAGSLALAVATKLVPLIFLPALLLVLGWRKALLYGVVIMISLGIVFLPMYDTNVLLGFSKSLELYIQKFEFNASVYYLIREFGFWKYGYNIIQSAGWKLGLISGLLILFVSLVPVQAGSHVASIPKKWLIAALLYFMLATIVHPWYITTLVALGSLTAFRFSVVWSAFIFLTYTGYQANGFQENLWWVALEYVAVISYLGYEIIWRKSSIPLSLQ